MWTLLAIQGCENLQTEKQITKSHQVYTKNNLSISHSITIYHSSHFQNDPTKLKFRLQSDY